MGDEEFWKALAELFKDKSLEQAMKIKGGQSWTMKEPTIIERI